MSGAVASCRVMVVFDTVLFCNVMAGSGFVWFCDAMAWLCVAATGMAMVVYCNVGQWCGCAW